MKQKFCSFFLAAIFFIAPSFSYAGVVINEIMYDVSGTDSGREWVEIYNPDSTSIDVSNYKFLESADASNHGLSVMSGSSVLPSGGYAAIVSDSAKFLADNPGFSGSILKASFGSLNNNGSTIILKSGTTVVDQVSYTSSLGAAGTGNSLQKKSSIWIPALPTPGTTNATTAASEDLGGSGTGAGGAATTTTSTTTTTDVVSTTTIISSNNTEVLSAHSATQIVTYVMDNPELKADAGRHRITTIDTPIEFEAEISGLAGNVSYDWSFGDGTTGSGKIVNHSYVFSGDYVVVLNVNNGINKAVSRTEVKVVSPNVVIVNSVLKDGYIELQNNNNYEVNIQNWKLQSDNNTLIFPRDTLIKANSSVKFPFKFGGDNNSVSLLYGDNIVESSFGGTQIPIVAYREPTREEIEIAKAKVAEQFAIEESQNQDSSLDTETSNIKISQKDKDNVEATSSIIDSIDKQKKDEESSLLATPVRFFKFIKNFFTK